MSINPRPAHQGERGATLIEMLVALAVTATSAYFFFNAMGEMFRAKKEVEVKNFAQTFEEPVRADLIRAVMGALDDGVAGGCFDPKQLTFKNLLEGKRIGGNFVIRSAKNTFRAGPDGASDKANKWRAAYIRCVENGIELRADRTSLYACMHLDQVNKGPKKEAPYILAEVHLALWDLKNDRRFPYCTPHQLTKGPPPADFQKAIYDFVGATKVGKPTGAGGLQYKFTASNSEEGKAHKGHLVSVDEFTGNPSRGFRMLYTLYVRQKMAGDKTQYDITTNTSLLGANSLPRYCTTRDPARAKFPEFTWGGKIYRSYGGCDFIPDLADYKPPVNPKIEIHPDDMDKFYPPPKSECTEPGTGFTKTTPSCAPDGPVDCTIEKNYYQNKVNEWHGACACWRLSDPAQLRDYKSVESQMRAKCTQYSEMTLRNVDCERNPGHEACNLNCKEDGSKGYCNKVCEARGGSENYCSNRCRHEPSLSFCDDICSRNSNQDFCPAVCGMNGSHGFCKTLCQKNPSYGFCPKDPGG